MTRAKGARTIAAALATAALGSTMALAHHSFSSFDLENNITIEGDIAEVQWTNPHAWMEVDVPQPDGSVVRWGVEFNSPNNLTRQGWKRDDLKTGDHVIFRVSPLRDGQPAGLFYDVVMSSGEVKRDPRATADLRRAEAAAAQ
jgi:hypothetical protein